MKNKPRRLSWAAVLDIVLVVLTVAVIIIAIIRGAKHSEFKLLEQSTGTAEIKMGSDVLVVYAPVIDELPAKPHINIHSDELTEADTFCNDSYFRTILIPEYEIAEIDMDNLEYPVSIVQADAVEECYAAPYIQSQYGLSDEECRLLAALVTLEVGSESYECQKAVASVVLNRMYVHNMSLDDVIYEPYQFSVAPKVKSKEPQESCVNAVNDVLVNGITIPQYVTFFRADDFHDWGDRYKAYKQIDRTYFSYDTKIKARYE